MNPQNPPDGPDIKGSVNMAIRIAQILAAVANVFLLSGQGVRAFGVAELIVFLILPVIAEAARSPEILLLWKCWTGFYLLRRLTPDRRELTNYIGHPWFSRALTLGLVPARMLRHLDVLLVLGAGYLAMPRSVALGKLLYAVAGGMFVNYQILLQVARRHDEAIGDAEKLARMIRR